MKNKFKFLVKMSLNRKIKTKWFAIANVILALLIIGITNIDKIINYFGGDFSDEKTIYVIDNTNQSFDLFANYTNEGFSLIDNNSYEVVLYDNNKEEAIKMIDEEEGNNIIIVFDDDTANIIKVTMISNQFSNLNELAIITNAVNSTKTVLAIDKYNISEEQMAGLTNPVNIEREILDESQNSTDENMELIMSTVFPILILPFFMLTIFLVQMIGAEVNDEKTTRGMEIIISNVSPKAHFFSKCLAGNLFIFLQALLLVIYVVLGLVVRRLFGDSGNIINDLIAQVNLTFPTDFLSSLIYIIPLILVLMLITFIGYSLLAGILASMTTNIEDFQQIQSPIMIISLIGYYLAMMAGIFKGAIFIKILGYIPFISAILSPSLFMMGDFGILDLFISIALMIVVIFLLIKYGLKVYKVGILNYSSGGLFKKMIKALKG